MVSTEGSTPDAEEIRGWGWPNATSWLLAHGELIGETKFDDVWDRLSVLLSSTIGDRAISLTLVDSGYKPGDRFERPEHQIYKFCRRHPGAQPSKGTDRQSSPYKLSKPDVRRSGKTQRGGLGLWWILTHHWKAWVYARIAVPPDDAGAWAVHRAITEDYARQVTNEEIIELPSGRLAWRTTGAGANHYLDCEVLAAAAAHICNVQTLGDHEAPPPPKLPPPPLDPAHTPTGI